jgi:hypothetical protein
MMGMAVSFLAGKRFAAEEPPVTKTNAVANYEPASTGEVQGFWLKLQNNKIVIYDKTKEHMIAETDIRKSDCSVRDIHLLENGIYLETMEGLFKYLQAHTS